jgi:hypothetical protein
LDRFNEVREAKFVKCERKKHKIRNINIGAEQEEENIRGKKEFALSKTFSSLLSFKNSYK